MPRYEIKPYREIVRGEEGKKKKGKKPTQTYGIWDNQVNNWVVNAKDIGQRKALKMLAALREVTAVDRIRPFWRD